MKRTNLKAAAFSMVMTALMLLPLTTNAQYRENQFGLQEWGQTSLLGRQEGGNSLRTGGNTSIEGITNDGFGTSPLGSGIAILIGAGLGYVALKKKEDQQ